MGAWDTYVGAGSSAAAGTPQAFQILAVKRELAHVGLGHDLNLSTAVVGVPAERAIRQFQAQVGVDVDGVVGPVTARALFTPRILALETQYGIQRGVVCQIVSLESNFDPGAVGVVDPADHGIVQINALAHPTITLGEAFSPPYALAYLATSLAGTYLELQDWDCAIAAWNVGGGGASDWCAMGKPGTGGPPWSPTLFARATQYVALVRSRQPCA